MTTKYLLDTHVVYELRKPRPHGGVVAWLELVANAYNVLPVDAATANVHGLTVATRNVADFKALSTDVFNPFAPGLASPKSRG